MSKPKINPRTVKQAEKALGFHCQEVTEMASDVGAKIMRDQVEWLDAVMKDILPPNLYELGQRGESSKELEDYISKHGIRVIFIPDHLAMRVMIGERVHAQFIPKLLLDGEPVSMKPEKQVDGSQN